MKREGEGESGYEIGREEEMEEKRPVGDMYDVKRFHVEIMK